MEDALIIGIDVAKDKLDIVCGGREHHCIANTPAAITEFCRSRIGDQPAVAGIEATGEYHIPAVRALRACGVTVRLINPLVAKAAASRRLRGDKTDRVDAATIRTLARDGAGYEADADQVTASRELIRVGYFLTRVRVAVQQRTESIQRKHLALEMTHHLDKLTQQMRSLEKEITETVTAAPGPQEQLISSIPGFGAKLASTVAHECGDITRFADADALVAYAGLDPRRRQSGAALNAYGRITKRGSAILRTSLFQAANIARQYDPELYAYYARKKHENRSHREILCIIARKLVHRIYAVVRDNRVYEKSTA